MERPRIAILFGGCSEEHDVSVKSAIEIAVSIDRQRYEPIFVGITRSGVWHLCDGPSVGWEARSCGRAVLSPDRETHGLLVVGDHEVRPVRIDAVFPVLHGTTGEDGAVQGLLELAGIPYVGCAIASSAICMDKSLAYVVARAGGIATPTFRVLDPASPAAPAAPAALDGLEYPVFVKPARSGSSFGVSRVESPNALDAAVAKARRYDDKVVVEEAVVGTEVGCAVLGRGPALTVGEIDQITLRHGFFRIHQESAPEQGSENAVVTVPAALPDATRARIQQTAQQIYRALGCGGLARVDMFLQDDGRIVLNEVNTLPGFTAYSRYPRMMAAAGLGLAEVIDRCLAATLEG
jgi:D-alanine--(R)-lactate ligase